MNFCLEKEPVMTTYQSVSDDWAEAQLRLRYELKKWVYETINHQVSVSYRGIHDELTWLHPLMGYYLISGDAGVMEFIHDAIKSFADWCGKNFYHGYYPNNENNSFDGYFMTANPQNAHHGIENFSRVIGHAYQLYEASLANEMLIDVSHHLGNWIPGIPEWYDFKKHEYRGSPGTRALIPMGNQRFQMFAWDILALHAYGITGEEKYFELALDHLRNAVPPADSPEIDQVFARKHGKYELVFGGMIPALMDGAFISGETELKLLAASYMGRLCSGDDWEALFKPEPISYIPQKLLIPLIKYRKLFGEWPVDFPEMPSLPVPFESPDTLELGLTGGDIRRWLITDDKGTRQCMWSPALLQLLISELSGDGCSEGLRIVADEANYRFRHASLLCTEGRYQGCRPAGSAALAFLEINPIIMGTMLGLPELYPLHDAVYIPEVMYYKEDNTLGLHDDCAVRLFYSSHGKRTLEIINSGSRPRIINLRLYAAIKELTENRKLTIGPCGKTVFLFDEISEKRKKIKGLLSLTKEWNSNAFIR